MSSRFSRRNFLRAMGMAAAGLTAASCDSLFASNQRSQTTFTGKLPMRPLGQTGDSVSLLGLGGQSTVEGSDTQAAVDIINDAIDRGVNYIDTSPRYGSTRSENNIGLVMQDRRQEVLLATKSRERTYTAVLNDFEESLIRLRTDYVDLYQVHNIGTASDVAELYQTDGSGRTAIDAFVRLRDEGRARFIGITGHHDPAQLLAVLEHSDPDAPAFDAILMALNPADWHRTPFQGQLLQTVIERKMAVIAMKITAMNHLLDEIPDMADCLNYVYSLPISCAVVGITDLWQLERNVQITQDFSAPLSQAEMEALENMTTATPDTIRPGDGGPRKGDWFKVLRY